MSRIGIVTFWWSQDNYGQLLQCYASQKYLQQLGHDAFLIKVQDFGEESLRTDTNTISIYRKLFSWQHWTFFIHHLYTRCYECIINECFQSHAINRKFDEFRDKHIICTPNIYTHKDLLDTPPVADVLITGSDMVWGVGLFRTEYFLDFAPKGVKCLSLAASFGRVYESLSDCEKDTIVNNLGRFQHITVRENEGIRICRNLGFSNVQKLCDPTMLLAPKNYELLLVKSLKEKCSNASFVYYLGADGSYIKARDIYKTLKRRNKSVHLCVSEYVDTLPKVFPSIEEWLTYIYYSDIVVTNSFHGTVFCLLFAKQFIVVPLKDKQRNTRVESLLREFGIADRICYSNKDLGDMLNNNIDYNAIKPKMEEFIEKSKQIIYHMVNS